MLLTRLYKQKAIHPPDWLPDTTPYLVRMGSQAYGCQSNLSDQDIYGFTIPPKDDIFPHLRGEIQGFGRHKHKFQQWQKHHVQDPSNDIEYDFQIYSIVKYFHLCMENNPNMIDSLFVPHTEIIHSTNIGNYVRENRHIFLHKGAWHKFKGYAYSQINKMRNKGLEEGSKRKELRDKYGYDVKFAMHTIRLLDEIEQILTYHDLNLQRNKEELKAIRNGEWSQEAIEERFNQKEKHLERLYQESSLPYSPDEDKIKNLLLECIEMHYGNISSAIVRESDHTKTLRDIKQRCEKALKIQ